MKKTTTNKEDKNFISTLRKKNKNKYPIVMKNNKESLVIIYKNRIEYYNHKITYNDGEGTDGESIKFNPYHEIEMLLGSNYKRVNDTTEVNDWRFK